MEKDMGSPIAIAGGENDQTRAGSSLSQPGLVSLPNGTGGFKQFAISKE
jgi:hypothetical protein